MKIGVLALQGGFAEHIEALYNLNIEATSVRLPVDLEDIDGLIIPGGESTTMSKLLSHYYLVQPIKDLVKKGLPVFGTCAGMVLLAKKVVDAEVEPLGAIDIEVRRNAYGSQGDSFEADLSISILEDKTFHGVFIRAPIVQKVGQDVEVLCRINNSAVAVKQDKLIACAFHPELTDDLRLHRYFLSIITGDVIAKSSS
jgi:5'-phosphate synthase pdxT subunit